MNSLIAIAFSLMVIYWLMMFFQKPASRRPCAVMDGLTFKKIKVIYPVNSYRHETIVKEWNVAVTTIEPDERYEDHSGWMMYVLIEQTQTIRLIALLEHIEKERLVQYYNACGSINRKVIKQGIIKGSEA